MRVLPILLLLAGAASSGLSGGTHAFSRSASPAIREDDGAAVRLTAVVTDPKGRAVAGLRAADFELTVDGAPQTVDSATLARASGAAPRAFAFLLDEFHVAAEDTAVVRDALLAFVDRHLDAADLALVFKPLDSLDTIAVTSDRAAVRRAIASFDGRKGDYTPRTDFEHRYMAQAAPAVAAARAQIVTSALRAIGTTLSRQGGIRPVIVLVSDGFGRMRTSRDVPANLQTAIRVANGAGAPVYAFAPALSAPASPDTRPDPAFTALTTLADETGGRLTVGTAGLTNALSRLAADLDGEYVLTYQPAHGSDGRFHRVQLEAKRAGAQVRTQAGYVAARPASAAAAPAPSAPLRVLRRSALIQSWSGFFPLATDRGTVVLTWERAPARTAARGRAASVLITATSPDGTVLFDAPVGPVGDPPSAERPNAATFEAPLGPVRVDMKILDGAGVVIDTDARDVAAPSARGGGPTIFPPAIVRARSAREFREAIADPQAAPVATRDFRRTDRLLIRVPVMDASGAHVPVTAVLLNRWRHPMREVLPLEAAGPRHSTQFDLPLAPLAPGEYSLRLTAPGPAGAPGVIEHVTFRVTG